MNIFIDNIDFYNLPAMKYYSFAKNYKGNKTEKAKEMVLSGNYMGACKKDGFFGMIIKDDKGFLHLRGRSEGVDGEYADKIDWIPHIRKELLDLPNNTVLLGEVYFPNNEGSRKVTTILGCLVEKALERQKEENKKLHFYCFDILAYNGKSLINTPIEKRINHYLYYELLDILQNNNYIELAEYCTGEELWELFHNVIASGGEGIVITETDCPYLPGKRTAWKTLKLKKELEDSIDVFLTGRYKNATKLYTGKEIETWNYWLNERTNEKIEGKLYRDYQAGKPIVPITKHYYLGNAGSIELGAFDAQNNKIVSVGWVSGISDEIKHGIVYTPEKYYRKCCTATCMEIEKIDGHYSMRHPKFVAFRDDIDWKQCTIDKIWKD